jgi:hypothetical protein
MIIPRAKVIIKKLEIMYLDTCRPLTTKSNELELVSLVELRLIAAINC